MAIELNTTTSRRDALKIGGVSLSLGALVAACGEDRAGDEGAARVGTADAPEALVDYVVDDVVRLRTASSLELTAIDVYETALSLDGAVADDERALVEQLIANHTAIADEMGALTQAAGGEAWTCTNPWLMDRLIGPALAAITGNATGVMVEVDGEADPQLQVMGQTTEMTDSVTVGSLGDTTMVGDMPDSTELGDEIEFTRLEGAIPADIKAFATALENIAAAAHQELAAATSILDARMAHTRASTLESRHAAVLAISAFESPVDGYVSPEMLGGEVVPDVRSQIPQYAIPATFGQTGQLEVKAGPGDLNNVRTSFILQTPAANSLIYNELSCDA